MTEYDQWWNELLRHPLDWKLRLVFADWLDDHGFADFGMRSDAYLLQDWLREVSLGACKRQVYEAGASGRPEQQEGWGWESFLLYGSFYDTKKSTVFDGADAAWHDGWTPYLYDFLHLSLKSSLVSV